MAPEGPQDTVPSPETAVVLVGGLPAFVDELCEHVAAHETHRTPIGNTGGRVGASQPPATDRRRAFMAFLSHATAIGF